MQRGLALDVDPAILRNYEASLKTILVVPVSCAIHETRRKLNFFS